MRWRLYMGAVLLALPVAAGANPLRAGGGGPRVNIDALMAEARLEQGRPRMAVEVADRCLQRTPTARRCQAVRARALAEIGRCDGLDESFRSLRATRTWDHRLATAESACLVRDGQVAGAVAALEEAAWLAPAKVDPLYARAQLALQRGDGDALADLVFEMEGLKRATPELHIARMWLALVDDVDADAAVFHARSEAERLDSHQLRFHVLLADCRRWLDVGDPRAALQAGLGALARVMAHPDALACSGEALRRQGDASRAWEVVDKDWLRPGYEPGLDAIRARILTDLGRVDEASELLDRLPATSFSDWTASVWYLARARGDRDAVSRTERAWQGRGTQPLTSLIPWGP